MDNTKSHYVVVTGIIVKDGRYLIVKRAPHEVAFPGKWSVPGGKLETNDYISRQPTTAAGNWYHVFEDLLRREVREETNLEIRNIRYLTNLAFIRPDKIPVVVVSLSAEYAGGEVLLCSDLTEHAWVTREEAKGYDLIDGIYEEMELLDAILQGKPMPDNFLSEQAI
ncbi:NUDIX domain-containing protein [Candidatus Woesearchaeota archaeon]|nr:NUDIX domain-containing protein [Candidatus Woesearchaeota archaeon]